MKKAAFIDRDGTLNEMVYDAVHGIMDSPRRPEQVALMKGAGEFLRQLRDDEYCIVVVTNPNFYRKMFFELQNNNPSWLKDVSGLLFSLNQVLEH